MDTAVRRIPRHADAQISSPLAWPLSRRRREAALLRARLHLAPGERVLVRAGHTRAASLLATDRALYWCSSPDAWTRRGWEEIIRLDADHLTTYVTAVGGIEQGSPRTDLPIRADERLIALARERIAATCLVRTVVTVDGHELPVEGRRRPGTGTLRWFVRVDETLNTRDAAVRGKIGRALVDLRASLGV